VPTINFRNIGDVLDFDLVRGTIVTVDPVTDTCTVNISGSTAAALLFYHCAADSYLRDNGSINGAAAGFNAGDEVIVMKKYDDSVIKVIGHADGKTHSCGSPYVIIEISTTDSGFVNAALVWDVKNDELKYGPCSVEDEDYAAWRENAKDDEDQENLFSGPTIYLRDFDELLVEGSKQSVGPWLPKETDEFDLGTMFGHIKAFGWYFSFYSTTIERPISASWLRGAEQFGSRISAIRENINETTYTFWGSTGAELGTVEEVYESHNYPDIGDPYVVYQGFAKDDYYPFPCNYIGAKNKKSVVWLQLHDFVLSSGTFNHSQGVYWNMTKTSIDSNRTIFAESQALYYPDDYDDSDILSQGNNAALSLAVIDTIEKFYDVNGLAKNAMKYIRPSITFVKGSENLG